MFKRIKAWWISRKAVANSEMQVYVSRKTTLPLELCTAENLRTAARYDYRQAKRYNKTGKVHHEASAEWYRMAGDALDNLAATLEHYGKEKVEELPVKERREAIEILKRMRAGKAHK